MKGFHKRTKYNQNKVHFPVSSIPLTHQNPTLSEALFPFSSEEQIQPTYHRLFNLWRDFSNQRLFGVLGSDILDLKVHVSIETKQFAILSGSISKFYHVHWLPAVVCAKKSALFKTDSTRSTIITRALQFWFLAQAFDRFRSTPNVFAVSDFCFQKSFRKF